MSVYTGGDSDLYLNYCNNSDEKPGILSEILIFSFFSLSLFFLVIILIIFA